jgi:hypothetical protein
MLLRTKEILARFEQSKLAVTIEAAHEPSVLRIGLIPTED